LNDNLETKEKTMGKYVYVYKGGSIPQTEEEQKRVMDAWMGWFGGLGDSVVDIGNPFGPSQGVNGSTSGLTGYSIVNADSLDAAVSKTGGCPILDGGGDIEVYETVAM
jgi:hypothetical protein